jgi:hypothetical protein
LKTAILQKGELIALIGLRELPTGQAVLSRIDPRDNQTANSLQDSPEVADMNLRNSVRRSIERGWRLVHFGPPNQG